MFYCRRLIEPGDKVTFNGKDHVCNRCPPEKSPSSPSKPGPSEVNHHFPQKGQVTQHGPMTSTPARPEQVVLDGHLLSPISDTSDYSSDSKWLVKFSLNKKKIVCSKICIQQKLQFYLMEFYFGEMPGERGKLHRKKCFLLDTSSRRIILLFHLFCLFTLAVCCDFVIFSFNCIVYFWMNY